MSGVGAAEYAEFIGKVIREPIMMAKVVSKVTRTEVAFHLMELATRIAPNVANGNALDRDVSGPITAKVLLVAHDPEAGALLAQQFGERMATVRRDMADLAGLYAEVSAADPFE